MDPRIRIRIHLKMTWIRNTAYRYLPYRTAYVADPQIKVFDYQELEEFLLKKIGTDSSLKNLQKNN